MNSMFTSGVVATAMPRRWATLAPSAVLHVALILVILYAGRAADLLPETTVRPRTLVRVVLPDTTPRLTPPLARLPPDVREAVRDEPEIPVPEIEKPPVPEPVVARVEPPRPTPEPRPEPPAVLDPPRLAPPVVQVGTFDASATSAQAAQPSQPIQRAGFDAVAVRASDTTIASAVVGAFEQSAARTSDTTIASAVVGAFEQSAGGGLQQPNIASTVVGAFEQSAGGGPRRPGRPNGVADAGFGSGVAVGPAGGGGGERVVATGGLDVATRGSEGGAPTLQAVKATDFDTRLAEPSAPRASSQAHTEVSLEILSKPTPAYTDEARALRIEGEVVLEVEFAATGEIRVLKVIRGLGHGLDESAARAVQGMSFKPAQRGGQPIDVQTTVNIVFRLA
jgi:TonB family protein